ncbi:hypothetical protein OESDEN_09071 [Oesophagostomum dentatum]|uniref:Uncharacterized protein n=1 Tax=Oesophagostomum dentatum TaxID=61180 RepID=A0A0B1T4K2_OESDE|nr:hypothetical protein OESDEN_09071 [Oesophagostomum dentatum]
MRTMTEKKSMAKVRLIVMIHACHSAEYFTPLQILLLCLMFGRFILAVIILLLGFKMEKDFMRSITVAVFIPMTFCEVFNIYCEVVAYLNLFSTSEEQYNYIYVTICLVSQIIPFFLSVLYYVSDGTTDTTLRILSIASRVVMIVCFIVITIQVFSSFLLLCRVLPYTHCNSPDMQLRDARSRLAWTLVYLILPYIALLPFLVDAFAWLIAFSGNPGVRTKQVQTICEMLEFIFHFHRPLWMTLITVAFLPPYRRAMLLTVICCGCCPKIQVDPLPRKPKDMSLMYRYADI